jgi:hypothetical protein
MNPIGEAFRKYEALEQPQVKSYQSVLAEVSNPAQGEGGKRCPDCGNAKDDPREDSIERMLACGHSFHATLAEPAKGVQPALEYVITAQEVIQGLLDSIPKQGTFEVRTEYLGDEPEDNAGWVATVYAKVGHAEGATEKEATDAAWQAAQSATFDSRDVDWEQRVRLVRQVRRLLDDNKFRGFLHPQVAADFEELIGGNNAG